MKPRLRDVARRAGVSEATVSRVVNGRPGVATPTRDAVLRTIAELGYRPVGVPSTPVRSRTVGVIVPELGNPIFPVIAAEIEQRLSRHDLTAVICTATTSGTQEAAYIANLTERGIAGFIVVNGLNADSAADHTGYRDLRDRGTPLVLVNGGVEGLEVPVVSADQAGAAELAVSHLAGLGHERIGLVVGARRYLPTQRMIAGYDRGMRAALGKVDDALRIETAFSAEGGHLAAQQLLVAGATAVLTASDLIALGVLQAAREQGAAVPEDLSVVGYDDIPLAAHSAPPLTTLRQPVRAMGAAAADALIHQIEGDGLEQAGEFLFRTELILRASTGPPAGVLARRSS